jgi:hypothetical protein
LTCAAGIERTAARTIDTDMRLSLRKINGTVLITACAAIMILAHFIWPLKEVRNESHPVNSTLSYRFIVLESTIPLWIYVLAGLAGVTGVILVIKSDKSPNSGS